MLSLTIHDLGELTVFQCAGRIIAGDADVLRSAVLSQSRVRITVLDMAAISAVDAAGIGMLVSLLTWAEATGAEIKLLNLQPLVEEILEITNLRSFFEVCSVREMMDLLCRPLDQDPFAAATSSIVSSLLPISAPGRCPPPATWVGA